MTAIAILRVRGSAKTNYDVKETLSLLHLTRVNHCVIVPNTPHYQGMIKKVKDYITWGEVSEDVAEKLLTKRGRISRNKKLTTENITELGKFKNLKELAKSLTEGKETSKSSGINPVFRLRPPSKGFERKGIRKPFSIGGALGNRKEKINDLLVKMI